MPAKLGLSQSLSLICKVNLALYVLRLYLLKFTLLNIMTTTKIQAIKELNAYLREQTHNRLVADLSSFDNWLRRTKQVSLREWLDQLQSEGLLNLTVNLASLALFAG